MSVNRRGAACQLSVWGRLESSGAIEVIRHGHTEDVLQRSDFRESGLCEGGPSAADCPAEGLVRRPGVTPQDPQLPLPLHHQQPRLAPRLQLPQHLPALHLVHQVAVAAVHIPTKK